ncbi:cell wall-binding repeat-containing protein [Catenulispora sp. GP43]|uniref:cell wall-binding repeat-containing protein n=1 Tax=Catenulispora sp. GP43 TaxID=3156263 RepID=UPI00351465C7
MRKPLAVAAVVSSAIAGAAALAPAAGAVNPGGVPAKSPLTVADGTDQIQVVGGNALHAPANVSSIAWSPKGDRYAYIDNTNAVHTVNRDGSGDVVVAAATGVQRLHPTWGDDGFTVGWSELAGSSDASVLRVTSADGSALNSSDPTWAPTGYTPSASFADDVKPEFGGDLLVFERDMPNNGPGPSVVMLRGYDAAGHAFQKQIAGTGLVSGNAWDPTISPDGKTVAFLQNVNLAPGSNMPAVFTVDIAPDGSTVGAPRQITFPSASDAFNLARPTFSADGKTIAVTTTNIDPSSPARGTYTVSATVATPGVNPLTKVSDHDGTAAYDTAAYGFVHRLAGYDRFDTADKASQSVWRTHTDANDPRPQANVAVLSRSDLFADALGGSALAAHAGGPLLLTSTGQLDKSTAAELTRVLAPGSTVYLLGGDAAISPAVETAVRHLGFVPNRIAGPDRYATAVAVAERAAPNPRDILVATGDDFPDALSAGAAAANDAGGVVVLTNDKAMPSVTRAYLQKYASQLQRQNGTVTAWAVGGQALAAYDTLPGVWYRVDVHGADRYATSLKLATEFFGGGQPAFGVATGANFPDALSGGALMGAVGGPLLLVNPAVGLSPADAAYLSLSHETLQDAYVLGGLSALPKAVDNQAGSLVAGAAGWVDLGADGAVVSQAVGTANGNTDIARARGNATDPAHAKAEPHGNAQPSR